MGISLSAHKARVENAIKDQFYIIHEEITKKQEAAGLQDTKASAGNHSASQYSETGAAQQSAEPKRRGRPPKAVDPSAEQPTTPVKKRRQKRAKRVVDPTKPKRQTGLNKPLRLSPDLGAFFERTFMPRTDVVKGLWVYIKKHEMQDPADKRYIICDDKFKNLFATDRLYMYTMNKQLNDHLIKLEPEELEPAQAEVTLHNPVPIDTPSLPAE
ncbi:hypothetical protein BB561_005570 [Smittium simulii]|uniref:DM2 domain-containing protein n=1 Tax=Smittium simulii TaxID=133385 RepID=A0A2T9Y9R9_9FUNG|nr:hypothetical protein BB561_005570 [Smittium simulii]